jgi:AAA family ATP:ADP antiporter
MFFIFFLISFVYNVLRSYKDTIVITAPEAGAEAIPFIKVWAVLPGALLITFLFTRLSRRLSREKVFYIMISVFICFFLLFAFVLYPAQEYLHPNKLADWIQGHLPSGAKGFIAIFRNWTFTLFYVMSELWSTAIFSVLFWGFANEVTRVNEAKRFYGLLGTGGNIAGIFSGQAAFYFSGNLFISWIPYGKTPWDQSIFFVTCAITLASVLILILFRWLNVHVISKEEMVSGEKKEKIRLSMRENFMYLIRSKYLICIAFIVLAYNLAMNLVEIVWKNQMKALYPNPVEYNTYMGQVMTAMGIIATLAGVLATGNLIRRYSWAVCASIPLLVVGVTGLAFFVLGLSDHWGMGWFIGMTGMSPLVLGVTLGSIQNCMSRASKYTFFDATKEIAFIPLSPHSKLKGKAAIDGFASRLGKSGGSIIHQGLLISFATVSASAPYVACVFLVVLFIWGLSIASLGKQFDALVAENAKLEILDNAPAKNLAVGTTQ